MDEVIRAKRQQTGSGMRAISIRGAREHNLQEHRSGKFRCDKLVVFTGLSGSGKIIARLRLPSMPRASGAYVESLSAYGRASSWR